jgi:hypothetical protein
MLLRLFRQGTTGKQRFSQLFWMCQRGPIFNLLGREPGNLETRQLNSARLPPRDRLPRLRRIAHLHASVAHRVADFALVLGAVNINETVTPAGVLLIQAIRP